MPVERTPFALRASGWPLQFEGLPLRRMPILQGAHHRPAAGTLIELLDGAPRARKSATDSVAAGDGDGCGGIKRGRVSTAGFGELAAERRGDFT